MDPPPPGSQLPFKGPGCGLHRKGVELWKPPPMAALWWLLSLGQAPWLLLWGPSVTAAFTSRTEV